jgi:DMSO/TMAO reductase YedYZ molybdopterin-dependent catalytic subunit
MSRLLTRRKLVMTGAATATGVSGIGAAIYAANQYGLVPPDHDGVLGIGETLTYAAQRLLTSGHSLAREFSRSEISRSAPVNGPAPLDQTYRDLLASGFKGWRVQVEGLIARPASFSLSDLKSMPAESRILLHACEEGWSYIAEWTGVRLSRLLEVVEPQPQARYIAFIPFPNPAQTTGVVRLLWDTIDMADALHPQTLLAYDMNGASIPADHGAPVRLRLGRHLGYKNTKYLAKIIVTDNRDFFRKGRGTWYGGI